MAYQVNVTMGLSTDKETRRRTQDVLAALSHEREATLLFLRPAPSHVGVREVEVTNGLFVDDIDELPELSGEYDVRYCLVVRAIAQN